MNEFSLIDRYFQPLGKPATDATISLGIGDDCALLKSKAGSELAISLDTLVAGIHFLAAAKPADIAYKALAVNLSDLAAMGAEPAWFTLSLTLPKETPESWVAEFASGLHHWVDKYALPLVGGDMTAGPLSISIQIAGWVPEQQALKRSGAKAEDLIFVTGELGWPFLGLAILQNQLPDGVELSTAQRQRALDLILRPQPLLAFGQQLRSLANAAIDISDGLSADLGHLLNASALGAKLAWSELPVAEPLRRLDKELRDRAINFGDEYQLLFTASPARQEALQKLAKQQGIALQVIGQCVPDKGMQTWQGKPIEQYGYQHFL